MLTKMYLQTINNDVKMLKRTIHPKSYTGTYIKIKQFRCKIRTLHSESIGKKKKKRTQSNYGIFVNLYLVLYVL